MSFSDFDKKNLRTIVDRLKKAFVEENTKTFDANYIMMEGYVYEGDWVENTKGEMPDVFMNFGMGTRTVEYKLKNGEFSFSVPLHLNWSFNEGPDGDFDIFKARLLKTDYTSQTGDSFSEVFDIIKTSYENENFIPFSNAISVAEYLFGILPGTSWIDNTGKRPEFIDKNQTLEIMFADEYKYHAKMADLNWSIRGVNGDIRRYRLVPTLLKTR